MPNHNKDKCKCGSDKDTRAKQCRRCANLAQTTGQKSRYEDCPGCGGRKRIGFKLCRTCALERDKLPPERFVCPKCGGQKYRDARTCENCKPKCPHCGRVALRSGIYCHSCRHLDIKDGFCTCSRCKRRLPIEEFWTQLINSAGRQPRSHCKLCWSELSRRRNKVRKCYKYGISKEQAELVAEIPSIVCPICGRDSPDFHIDHCHATNKARGLVCSMCNKGLGCFSDNTAVMLAAIDYLRQFEVTGQPIGFPK